MRLLYGCYCRAYLIMGSCDCFVDCLLPKAMQFDLGANATSPRYGVEMLVVWLGRWPFTISHGNSPQSTLIPSKVDDGAGNGNGRTKKLREEIKESSKVGPRRRVPN